jgi:hypothetical protein
VTARDVLDGIKARLSAANDYPGPVTVEQSQSDVARLTAAVDAALTRLDEWDSYKAFPDAEETQVWYSAGKRHASEAIRAAIETALEGEA